ncbi:MAG: hypothetical protein ACYTBJ_10660 [Planctomycetota bacterium]
MKDGRIWSRSGIVLGVIALLCWIIMFLAGTDVWHDTGSHDFWRLEGPPYDDLRVLAYAFYLTFVVLIANLAVQIRGATRKRRQTGTANS